jgi:hypothetical protein
MRKRATKDEANFLLDIGLNDFFASNEKCVVVLLIYEKIVGKYYFYTIRFTKNTEILSY